MALQATGKSQVLLGTSIYSVVGQVYSQFPLGNTLKRICLRYLLPKPRHILTVYEADDYARIDIARFNVE